MPKFNFEITDRREAARLTIRYTQLDAELARTNSIAALAVINAEMKAISRALNDWLDFNIALGRESTYYQSWVRR